MSNPQYNRIEDITQNEPHDFCGAKLPNLSSDFVPKSSLWESRSVLAGLSRGDIQLSDDEIKSLHSLFWNDVCSEYDAENFCVYLEKRGCNFSPEFVAFERAWRRDEWNHYLGFRFIYSLLFSVPEDVVARRLAEREVNFAPLEKYFEDEFIVCLLLAYDEIATTKAYFGDFALYRLFGNPAFYKWIRLVTRDEAYHFQNLIKLIRHHHSKNIKEIPKIVREFIDWDLSGNKYKGTFVLDHEGNQFTPLFLEDCIRKIANYVRAS